MSVGDVSSEGDAGWDFGLLHIEMSTFIIYCFRMNRIKDFERKLNNIIMIIRRDVRETSLLYYNKYILVKQRICMFYFPLVSMCLKTSKLHMAVRKYSDRATDGARRII